MISGKVGILVSLFPVSKKNVTYLVLKEETLQKIQVTVPSTKGRIKRGREQKDEADIRKKMGIIFLLALFEKKRKKTYTYLQKEDKKKKNIHVSLSLVILHLTHSCRVMQEKESCVRK